MSGKWHYLLHGMLITLQSIAPPRAMGMSFAIVGHANKFSGTHTTDYTVFEIRAINFGNDLATINCLVISSAEFPIMVSIEPLPNSQFPNPTKDIVSHSLRLDKNS